MGLGGREVIGGQQKGFRHLKVSGVFSSNLQLANPKISNTVATDKFQLYANLQNYNTHPTNQITEIKSHLFMTSETSHMFTSPPNIRRA